MVHVIPSSTGVVETFFSTKRTGVYIANFDLTGPGNVTITPRGGGGIQIVLPPGVKLKIPDKIGLLIEGASSQRNFVVLDWEAGHAN